LNLWSTQGFVLSARPYLEADKLIQVYTRQWGKIRARVRGARKPKSRLGYALELFTESALTFTKGPSAELYLLTQAKLLRGFPSLKEDFGTITLLQVMADILVQSLQDGEPDEKLYELILESLENLEAQSRIREIVVAAFILRLLEAMGHPLELELCAECQAALGQKGAYLIAHRGGALGPECFPSGPGFLKVSAAQLGPLRKIRSFPWDRLTVLKMEKSQAREILFVLLAYLEKTIEKPLKSVDYYRSVLPV
jgi:DNA repair protein RecO (recombination protein O)